MTHPDRIAEIADELSLTDDLRRAETAVEYSGHDHCTPLKSQPGCIICDNHDSLHCARGRHCVANGAHIGEWIGSTDNGNPTHASAPAFEYPSLPGVLFCEDCVDDIQNDASGDPILDGDVSGLGWSVHFCNEGFYGFLATFDPSGGASWERELDTHDSLGVAVVFARTEAERLIAIETASEARALAGMPTDWDQS